MNPFAVPVFAVLAVLPQLASADPRVDIAKAFVANAHTGQSMRAEQWLTKDVRTAKVFIAFGGIDALIRQTTARADRFGGLKTVEVISATPEGGALLVRIEVRFNRDADDGIGSSAAAAEPMIWEMRVVREDGSWKLRL
ncbi:MAG TPA: hypothetical protein VMU96_04145 [Casimicrobiaceae bacterium]|nr:hypothetical protein [Casimicrobiaceae bacterium]